MDRTTQALQQELTTWICQECNRHYSRRAAESVDWHCEDCKRPLLDARGQKVEGKKAA
jgi:ribosomal protein L37AE/L43A